MSVGEWNIRQRIMLVVNGGIVATSVWFGKGDFVATENLAFSAADFADTDRNAANAGSVVAAMHGMAALPAEQVAALTTIFTAPPWDPCTSRLP